MKKLLLIISFFVLTAVQAQKPISLNLSNMPFYPQLFRVMVDTKSEIPTPEVGRNLTWEYSSLAAVPNYDYGFFPAKNPFYPAASYVDTPDISGIIYDKTFKYSTYCKVDASGIIALGNTISMQDIYLGDYTAGTNDRLVLPEQHCVYNNPVKIVSFPMTVGSVWHNSYRNFIDYYLTIESLSLEKAALRRVSYVQRTDSVVGWGKVIVPTPAGPSKPYDVLMVSRTNIQKDSFYVNGAPATSDLLQSFCLMQGKTIVNNKYIFWRENAAYPILIVHFGYNNFTTPIAAHYDGSVESPMGIDQQAITAGMNVYPNPNDGQFTIEFSGIESGNANISLFDMLGKEFYQETRSIDNSMNLIKMQLNKIPKGEYFLVVKTAKNKYLNKLIIW